MLKEDNSRIIIYDITVTEMETEREDERILATATKCIASIFSRFQIAQGKKVPIIQLTAMLSPFGIKTKGLKLMRTLALAIANEKLLCLLFGCFPIL